MNWPLKVSPPKKKKNPQYVIGAVEKKSLLPVQMNVYANKQWNIQEMHTYTCGQNTGDAP